MARLKVFLDGQVVSQHSLTPNQELIAGRGESCDCILKPEKGISRQHFRLHLTEMGWELESLSRFGELYLNGEKIEKSLLQNGNMFSVPPYEFIFEDGAERVASDIPLPSVSAQPIPQGESNPEDKTFVGPAMSAAILKLLDARGQPIQTYSLQGLSWVAGRDIGCSIFIDNQKISRRQFEIQKVEEAYFIRDLGSVNGTLVNNNPIPSDQWTQMASSDVIAIADWTLVFEIRDAQFEQRLKEVDTALRHPPALMNTNSGVYGGAYNPNMAGASDPAAMPAMYVPRGGNQPPKQGMKIMGKTVPGLNPIRLMIGVIILAAAAYTMMDSAPSEDPQKTARLQTPFETLNPEKQQLVKQAYQLARDLYTTGKYELANQKIIEIHAIIPYYEDSKELQQYVDNAIEIQRNRDKLLAQSEEEKKRKEKVEKAIVDCRKLLQQTETIQPVDMETCLAPVLEFDPENQEFVALRAAVDQIILDRNLKMAKDAEYKKQVARRELMYKNARKIDKSGRSLAAISAYKAVVKSALPDPAQLGKKSERRIASIRSKLGKQQRYYINAANADLKAGNRKAAIKKLRAALRINPTNYEIEDRITKIIADIRKEMQVKYQEAILEESIGSVTEAKKRWHEIIQASIPGEEYYNKSKVKLRKYGEVF